MSRENIVKSANKKFNEGQFSEALHLYNKASILLGEDYFYANINLCKKRLSLYSDTKDLQHVEKDNSHYLNKFPSNIFLLLQKIENKWKQDKVDTYNLLIPEIIKSKKNHESLSINQLISNCQTDDEKNAVITSKFWSSILSGNINLFIENISEAFDENDLKPFISRQIYEAGIYFKEKNLNKEALTALKIASKYYKDEKWLQTTYWLAHRQSDYYSAWRALGEIKEIRKNRKLSDEWIKKAAKRIDSKSAGFADIVSALSTKEYKVYKAEHRKIAYFLHNSLPYSSGGYATRAHGIATGLQGNGFKVICVSRPGFPLDTPGDHIGHVLPQYEEIDGIEYHRIFEPMRKNVSGNLYILDASRAIESFLIENKIDIVIAASNHLTAIPAGIAAKQLGLPYFYEVRGFWEVTRVSREPQYEHTPQYAGQVRNEAEAAIHADHVFTLTTPMLDELIQRGVPAEKITLLPNSCDPSRFTPRSRDLELARKLGIPEGVPVIGYIGSFVQYEGLENLAQASALLLQRGIDFRLLLVGNENASGTERGPITKEILRVANEEGLSSKLIMPGRVPHEQVEAYYSLIDIAPFPRKPQPVTEMVSPMKPLEALAMEKAVLVSSVRALTEMIIENKTGLVFQKGNITDLADKLETMINDATLRQRLGKAGRKWVQTERTWEKTTSIACGIINNAMNSL